MNRLSEVWLRETVARSLAEDIGTGDITTSCTIEPGARGKAIVIAREEAVIAGMIPFIEVFSQVGGVDVECLLDDGQRAPAGSTLINLKGELGSILIGERTALNFLMRLSGIATLASKFVKAVEGTKCRIVDTRKTTPGLRALEKAAVAAGGGHNHRFGLFDGVLIKDNHIAAAGSIAKAVKRARASAPHTLKIEVEAEKLHQMQEAIDAGADIVLLDNMEPEDVRRAVEIAGGRVLLEASGNMSLDRVGLYARAGVDIISVGALTHSAPSANLSLEIRGSKTAGGSTR